MKLSTKGRYAVMAMADLALNSDGSPVTLSDISERQDISLAYLEQLFAKLRKNGLVESTRGPGGGYSLARPADDMPIADIVLAVDEPIKVIRCSIDDADAANDSGKGKKGCVGGGRCMTHDLWAELGRHIHLYLTSVSLGDVVGRRVGRILTDQAFQIDPAAASPN